MEKTLRKIIYILLFILCLSFGLLGLFNKKDKPVKKQEEQKPIVSSELYIICSLTTPYNIEGTEELNYTENDQIIIGIKDNAISNKTNNSIKVYSNVNNFNEYINTLNKEDSTITIEENTLTIKQKKEFDESLLTGIEVNQDAIKNIFIEKGYTCK